MEGPPVSVAQSASEKMIIETCVFEIREKKNHTEVHAKRNSKGRRRDGATRETTM